MLRAWSSTQSVIALSSGEAEYYTLLKGVSGGLGMKSLMNELGLYPEVTAKTDSTAAKGMVGRRGLGKTRHADVCYLCLQDMALRREVTVTKIPGDTNPADSMAKYLAGDRTAKLREDMGL